jgi:hypothetical protein
MASAYPAALDTTTTFPQTIVDGTDAGDDTPGSTNVGFLSQLLRDLGDAAIEIETELGVTPSAAFVDVATRLNQMITVRKTADQTLTGTTAVNITDLAFPIPATAGISYTFDFTVMWTTSGATSGLGISLTFPTLGTGGYCSAYVNHTALAADGAAANFHGVITGASGADVVMSTAAVATGTVYVTHVRGVLYAGTTAPTAGTLQLQGRSEQTSGAGVVKVGSHGILWTG